MTALAPAPVETQEPTRPDLRAVVLIEDGKRPMREHGLSESERMEVYAEVKRA